MEDGAWSILAVAHGTLTPFPNRTEWIAGEVNLPGIKGSRYHDSTRHWMAPSSLRADGPLEVRLTGAGAFWSATEPQLGHSI